MPDDDDDDLDRRVIEAVCRIAERDPEQVPPEFNMKDDLGLDSLEMVEMVMAVEDACSVEISDDELLSFVTIDDVIDHVRGLKASA